MGIIFFEVYWFDVNRLKFISRCDWLISLGGASIHFWTIINFLPFFLLFIQNVSFWILIFHSKVSNFLVDILKLQGNKFLKINKFINKTFAITIVPPDINVLIDITSIIFGVPLISVSLFIWCFSLLISLIFSVNFLFTSDNSVCIFLIFDFKSLTLLALLVFSTFRLFLFWIFSPLNLFSSLNRLFIVSISAKCSLMSFFETSTPSDDKSTKPVGVQLIYVYLLFFSTK